MNNQLRRELLQRHRASGFPGSILDVYKAYDQGVDLIGEYQQKMMQEQQPQVAKTPEQQREGLRPQHAAGNTNASMIFPNVPPNQPFNTVGMKAPIDIKKFDEQGHLVKSYNNVPPGIQSLPTGPHRGTVLETPSQMKSGGVRKYQEGGQNPFFAFTPPVTPGSWDHTLFDINYNWGPDQIGDTLDLNALDLVAIERMGVQNPEEMRLPLQYHESGSQQRMQPNAVQISGTEGNYYMGPGRGYYMYDKPSTLRDATRLRTISNNMGVKPPQFALDLIKSDGTASADTLTAEQQDMLMMANLIMDPKAPFRAYGAGEASLEDLWYKGVNRRDDEDKAREEFRESYDAYEDEDDMLQYLFMDPKPNYFEAQAKKKKRTGGQKKYITRKLRRR